MPRYHLTFDYPGHAGERIVGEHVVSRATIGEAVEYVAAQRGIASIHIRGIGINGAPSEPCDFTFGPGDSKAVA